MDVESDDLYYVIHETGRPIPMALGQLDRRDALWNLMVTSG
jgi:hypothetical protein